MYELHGYKLDEFTHAYLIAALWSSTDDHDEPLDANYKLENLSNDSIEQAIAECAVFQSANHLLLTEKNCLKSMRDCGPMGHAGHDFWLTRNGHGAGFWDGDWEEVAGEKLTEACKNFGGVYLHVRTDDDGKKVIGSFGYESPIGRKLT